MRLKVRTLKFLVKNKRVLARLRQLANKGGSAFRENINEVLKGGSNHYGNPLDVWAVLAIENKKIIGWGCVELDCYERGTADVGVYVAPSYRKKGIAKILVKRFDSVVKRKGRYIDTLYAFPFTPQGVRLFSGAGYRPYQDHYVKYV